MRGRQLCVVGVSVLVAVSGLRAAKPHLNPMVTLLEQKQAVFGLYLPRRGCRRTSTWSMRS